MCSNPSDSTREERVSQAIFAYLKSVEEGSPLDRQELLGRHPDLAKDLVAFFADRDRFEQAAGPLRAAAAALPAGDVPTIDFSAPPSTGPGTKVRYFGDYELLEEIARGGMGVVYKARQVNLKRIVALKLILAGQLAGPQEVQRFHAEAEAAAKLDHPGIVPIFEVDEHEGQHYFSMAFVDGESLARRVAQGVMEPREAASVMRRVAEAIAYAHLEGVIHRDLKPGNILLDKDGTPRVTDFGLAKRVEGESQGLTTTGQVLGTPSYMPPEQAAGDQAKIGPLADVYSLGAVLYCLVTGRPPFQTANPMDTLLQVLEQEPVSPRRLNPAIPRDLETISLKCLEKEPGRRYRSAQDLAEDLQRYLDDEPILARPVGVIGRFRRWTRRRPVLAGCAFSLVGLLLVVAGFASLASGVVMLGSAGMQFIEDRTDPAFSFPIAVEKPQATEPVSLSGGGLNQLELKVRIRSRSFDTDQDGQSRPQYNFRVTYAVLDEDGRQLDGGVARIVWNPTMTMRRWEDYHLDEQRREATLAVLSSLGKFATPPSGKAKFQLNVEPDRVYQAEIQSLELRVFANVRDTKQQSFLGGILCVSAPLLLLIALALILYGPFLFTTRAKKKARV